MSMVKATILIGRDGLDTESDYEAWTDYAREQLADALPDFTVLVGSRAVRDVQSTDIALSGYGEGFDDVAAREQVRASLDDLWARWMKEGAPGVGGRTVTITVTDEKAPCWSDDVVIATAPLDARPLVRDGEQSITTSNAGTIAWAQRCLGGAVEIETVDGAARVKRGAGVVTIEPVTLSGWYETTDGSVTRFDWRNGHVVEGDTVANWDDVPNRDSRS